MDDRIGRRAANGGVDQTAGEMAVAIIPRQLPTQDLSDKVRAVAAHAPRRSVAMLPSPAPRMHNAVVHRVCLGTRISMTKPRAQQMRPLARAPMHFAREILGNMQPARSLARFPCSASSSDI